MEIKKEKRVSGKTIYSGNILNLKRDEVEFCNNIQSVRELVEHSGGVSVLAENDEGKVLLIKQYRYPVDEVIYEIPAGKLEIDEEIVECASRELREETGYQAEEFSELYRFYPTPGYSTEVIYIYKAKGLSYVGTELEEGEYIEVVPKSRKELQELLKNGELKDSKTLIAVLHYLGEY
ncbi:NUDIX domain-containing protein [Halanaerobium hydrogeniformans]|uniref:NUDIX hydrolase n=1 Tax=Halanaerobium hydrogeniformans TaxID=656519 RepID=E4RL47_HALHG|nr:NUDIX hydrolase [Halanaerobium hydrogeniformans]ADQ14811.1 NUDIX hydrolase [Halanaerobium hydrogeniformans]